MTNRGKDVTVAGAMENTGSANQVSELLARVTRQLGQLDAGGTSEREAALEQGSQESVLEATAARYCSASEDFSVTPPTGFDFQAGALFEAIVESAFLVANADGNFDDVERRAFTQIVLAASQHRVSERQVEAIILDLTAQFEEDGLERRLAYLSCAIGKVTYRREVLLIAATLAEVSSGVSREERLMLERLAEAFALPAELVDVALEQVRRSLLV